MVKRILAVIMLSCLLPVMAYAANWTLLTSAKSIGGTVQVNSNTPQNSSNGVKTTYFPVGTPATVTVMPGAGYVISKVDYNGTILDYPTQTSYAVDGPNAQNVYAWFAVLRYSITASVAGGVGGTVIPSSTVGYAPGTVFTTPQVFTFTPISASYTVSSITGIPAGAIKSPAVPLAGQTVTVTFPVGFAINSNIVLEGTFTTQNPIANAGLSQSSHIGATATLDGTASISGGGISSYSWSQVSGPVTPLVNANTAIARFTPTAAGTYVFSLTLMPGGSTASTTVTIYNDANELAINKCQNCHVNVINPIISNAYIKWYGSKHQIQSVVCSNCHIGTDTGAHPGSFNQENSCSTVACHGPGTPTINVTKPHPIAVGSNPCTTCHDPHNQTVVMNGPPHFNNISTGVYPASYATNKTTCTNCHGANTEANRTIRLQWTASGHAKTNAPAWILDDYKTLDGCVRCHTATGFIAYSTAKMTTAWGVSSDKTKEVLRCNACHINVETGTTRTNVTLNNPYPDEPSFTNNNIGTSNLCISCHSGTNNGASIQVKVATPNYFANTAYIASHGMSAAGSLQGKSAFHFPGRTYPDYSQNSHSKVGMNNSNATGTQGPCVACHMSSPSKHTFASTSSANRTIVQIKTNVCTNCHNTSLTAATLDARRVEFNTALDALKAALVLRGFTYTSTPPYFTNTNWGVGQAGANVMGAAYNYRLFLLESSAYTHNPAYARQLVIDSIDAAYNYGSVTGDITSALTALVGNGSITQAQADSLNAYKASTSCNSCHGAPPSTPSHSMATPANCANCHIYTGPAAATHNNGTLDFQTTMACGSCHLTAATNPQLATGTHTLHFAALQSTDPMVVCTKCHTYNGDTVAPHNNGTLNVTSGCSTALCHGTLTVPVWGTNSSNDSCTKCHGTGTATITSANRYVVAPSDATATDRGQVSANAKTGAHQTHIRLLNGLSPVGTVDGRCQNCHGTLPDFKLHSNLSSTPAFQGLATNNGAMTTAGFAGTSCSNTYCHNPAGSGGTLNPANAGTGITPSWTNSGYIADGTLKTLNNCNKCHKVPGEAGFASTMDHGSITIADDCAGCHSHNGDVIGVTGQQHIDGIKYGNGSCDSCHGYPPLSQAQFDARVPGMYPNAKVEDYTNGGGHHISHLSMTVKAADGFAPCLPCHPSGYHKQGGTVVTKNNVNVFETADVSLRFDDSRSKRYDVAARTCSNVSCHFQPTPAW
ncbi:MAG: PKD domain-containing protein [Desulfuromonadaceae bacterium]